MTEKPSTAAVLSDKATTVDGLNVTPYAKTLAEIIADANTDTPLTIGVFGTWGQGKTSLMQMVRDRLDNATPDGFTVRTVWFNAWLYSQQPALWRALISKVLTAARKFDFKPEPQRALDAIEKRLYGVTQSESGYFTLPTADFPMDQVSLPPLMGLDLLRRQLERKGADKERLKELDDLLADVSESETQNRREMLSALDDFRRVFEEISKTHIVPRGRVVIFVDDLDRCLPDKAVEVLEAIKLFLDVPGCIFVLGVDREVIEEGIKVRYADYEATLNGAQYLEKII